MSSTGTSDIKLDAIMVKNDRGGYSLFACKGTGRGCKRNSFRLQEHKKPCDDCLECDPDWSLKDVMERVMGGNS